MGGRRQVDAENPHDDPVEVAALDGATYGAVGAFVMGVAALAAWIPSLRAARTKPTEILRAD